MTTAITTGTAVTRAAAGRGTATAVADSAAQPSAGTMIPGPQPEGGEERFGDYILGCVRAEPAYHVPVDVRRVPAEHRGELLGVPQGPRDDRTVIIAVPAAGLGRPHPAWHCHG